MTRPAALVREEAVRDFLARQRWFGGKARRLLAVRIVDEAALTARASLVFVEARHEDGAADTYLLPLATTAGPDAVRLERDQPGAIVQRSDAGHLVYDALFDDEACRALLALARGGGELPTGRGRLRAAAVSQAGGDSVTTAIARTAPDQSNTSVIFGAAFIMKVFRRVEDGVNPDVELCTFLTRRGFRNVPATIGTVEYISGGAEPASAAMVQRFVPNRGNGWQVTLASLARYLGEAHAPLEEHVRLAEQLGRRTGELHRHLAAATEPALAPESYSRAELDRKAGSMRAYVEAQLALLSRAVDSLPSPARTHAERVLGARDAILESVDALRRVAAPATCIRCHGDYHLGQVLVTDEDVVILDFEGEPARPLAERRARSSPLRDVAGMLRSFSYAAVAAMRAAGDERLPAGRQDRADRWNDAACARFLRAYRDGADAAGILPADSADFDALLRALTIEKAAYELGYELNNRPDWVEIPLVGLLRLADIYARPQEPVIGDL